MTQGFGRAEKRRQMLEARKDFLNELNRIRKRKLFTAIMQFILLLLMQKGLVTANSCPTHY